MLLLYTSHICISTSHFVSTSHLYFQFSSDQLLLKSHLEVFKHFVLNQTVKSGTMTEY